MVSEEALGLASCLEGESDALGEQLRVLSAEHQLHARDPKLRAKTRKEEVKTRNRGMFISFSVIS